MKNGTILTGDVGSGKTITSIMYYYVKVCGGLPHIRGVEPKPMKTPKDLYIITTANKRDKKEWDKDALLFGLGRESNQDGVQIHVDSWNNISQYELVDGAFFIFDEQRLVGNGEWVKSFLKIAKQNEWIILSATPGDIWMDYIPVFLANGFYKNRTEFLRRHVVYNRFSKFPKVDRYLEIPHLERLRASILVDMPYERHTIRNVKDIFVDYDKEQYQRVVEKRWHIYEDRPLRDAGEMTHILRRLVNLDTSRIGALMELLEKHPKLIVFYNFNYELDAIRVLADILNYPKGEWNGQKHESIPTGEKWLYLVQYAAGAEGWNCVETDAMAFYSLNYSYRNTHQARGRIDRLNTPFNNLYYYILRSMAPIDKAILRSLRSKQNFNEKAFRDILWDSHDPF